MHTIAEMVERNSFIGDHSAALGATVSRKAIGNTGRQVLGTIVEVTNDRKAVWVRRFDDPADVSVWYSVNELELATVEDIAYIGRVFLNRQYLEAMEVRKAVRA